LDSLALPASRITLRLPLDFCRTRSGRREIHSGSARFGQANGNGLFAGLRSMFSFADVMELFPHKFPGLSGW
jgi:hypothetical protein